MGVVVDVVSVVSGRLSWASVSRGKQAVRISIISIFCIFTILTIDVDGVSADVRENGEGCKDNIGADGEKMDPNLWFLNFTKYTDAQAH